jgi:biotin operon repressor
MRYQRSKEIEERLDAVLGLIESGDYSTPNLAKEIGVSIPTISRCVQALRERGFAIRAERSGEGWRYVLDSSRIRETRPSKSRTTEARP